MTAALVRLLALAAAAVAISAAAGGLHAGDAAVKLKTDSLIVAREIEIVNGTCPAVRVGPLESRDCVRQLGAYYIAYLPPGYVVRVRDGWVVGLYERLPW
jgi:hypothetical protein